jgi:DNA-binding response OmpR family regulator
MAYIPEPNTWIALIVDDERDNLELASMGLKLQGATTHTAVNGREALALVETITPTFVLLDIDMPAMDGYEVVKIMRENPRLNQAPIIAMTAKIDGDEGEIFFIKRGFDGLLVKPFSIRSLAEDIKVILRNFTPPV